MPKCYDYILKGTGSRYLYASYFDDTKLRKEELVRSARATLHKRVFRRAKPNRNNREHVTTDA